ncbi:hypothetical protein AB0L06_13125 [Spirillospora sp. NPDC052269]
MVSTPDGGAAAPARPAVYLHVGAAKSGTTYLQGVLWHNREVLRRHGILYPGRDFPAHVRAAFDLRKTFFAGASDPEVHGAWTELVDEIRDWPGVSVISQELFAPAAPRRVRRALADLDFADVHVVFTVRDLARQIPAHWQEDVKNRFTTGFGDFVDALSRPDWDSFDVARLFWGLQDPVAVLGRWAADLPPERVHVVTLPRPGAPHDLLWRRFSEAVGIPADACDLSAVFANPSLGLAETQFLRLLNVAVEERVDWHLYNDEVKLRLAQQVLTQRPSGRIGLPVEHMPWAVERSVEAVEGLRAAGYRVVGDLYELIPTYSGTVRDASGGHPDRERWAEIADSAADAVAALLHRLREEEQILAELPDGLLDADEQLDELAADTDRLDDEIHRIIADTAPFTERAARSVKGNPAVRRAYHRLRPPPPEPSDASDASDASDTSGEGVQPSQSATPNDPR